MGAGWGEARYTCKIWHGPRNGDTKAKGRQTERGDADRKRIFYPINSEAKANAVPRSRKKNTWSLALAAIPLSASASPLAATMAETGGVTEQDREVGPLPLLPLRRV